MSIEKKPKVSIGLPTYNAEKFIVKKIESILNQTITDFELIISDNASTDKTIELLEGFVEKDNRIKLFKQKNNFGAVWNFNFVLENARGDYFLWTAADDIQLPTFIEKNLMILETNPEIACSISRIKLYGDITNYLELKQSDSILIKSFKKFKKKFGYMDSYPAAGSYEKRVKEYLKTIRHNQIFYGVYRISQIKNAHVRDSFLWVDGCTTLNILKFGELYVVDEILLHVYDEGISRKGMIDAIRYMNHKRLGKIFPYYPFTCWCIKNLKRNICLQNLGFFIRINCIGVFSLIIDIGRRLGIKI